jgi:hypothetical protein
MTRFSQPLRALAVLAVAGGGALLATPAAAWWHGGVFIGLPPVVVAPAPAYYPPYPYYPYYPYAPGYYAPPPAATPVPQAQGSTAAPNQSGHAVAYGTTCHAGVYTCAAPWYTPVGKTCVCPGIGAPSYGTVN